MLMLKTFMVFFFLSFYSLVLATSSSSSTGALFHSTRTSSFFGKSVPVAVSTATSSQKKSNTFATFGKKRISNSNNIKKYDDTLSSSSRGRIPIDFDIQAKAHSSSSTKTTTTTTLNAKNKYVVDTVVSTIWS